MPLSGCCCAGLKPAFAADLPGLPKSMLELPNPFSGEYGVMRLLEPADSDRATLVERILSGTYDKPFMIEEGDSRSLYFTRELTQSGMRLSDPTALEFEYTRQMMSFLLFVNQPQRILLLGLGGGSLVKYCHRHLRSTRITALEIDPHVIAFREQFLLPPDDARLKVLLADAAVYLRGCNEAPDVVMMDAFDRDGFANSVSNDMFYADVRDALAPHGVLVANLVGAKPERAIHLQTITDAFDGNVIVLSIENDGNYLAFAFREKGFEPRWRWIEGQARAMQKRYGLDFPKFAVALKRSRRDGYLLKTLHQTSQ